MTKNEKRIFVLQWSLKAGVALVIALLLCFALIPKGFGWFVVTDHVSGEGLQVTVEHPDGASFDAAYAGNFKFTDRINFGIDDSLLLYPQNYITVVFNLAKELDFAIDVQEKKLTLEEFGDRFGDRRDLLLGDYTLTDSQNTYFDVESIFAYVEYNGSGYDRFFEQLPARPSISMAYDSGSAFDYAYAAYLENSHPYLMDFLYRFSRQNSLYDTITFSLYVQAGESVTEYLLLPDGNTEDGIKYIPTYTRTAGSTSWSPCSGTVTLAPNLAEGSATYALVIGYGTDFYLKNGSEPTRVDPLRPIVTVEPDSVLYFEGPASGLATSPYVGTYYSNTYNCFIGSSLAVRFISAQSTD